MGVLDPKSWSLQAGEPGWTFPQLVMSIFGVVISKKDTEGTLELLPVWRRELVPREFEFVVEWVWV